MRPNGRRWGATAFVVASLVLTAGCEAEADAGPRPAPGLSGQDLEGDHHDLADLAGDVVIVNAWASWCGPCREEMPVLARAQDSLGDAGLQVLGLNVRDRPEAAAQLIEDTEAGFPSIVDPDGRHAVTWGVRGMPQTFLVDRSGDIVDLTFGAVDDEWIESTVAPLVHEEDT